MRKLMELRVSTGAGLAVIGAVLGLFVGLGWWTVKAQDDAKKVQAANIMRSLASAQGRHHERHGRYAPDLDALGDPWSRERYTDLDGYTYEVLPPSGDPATTWAARATPAKASWPSYYVDHTYVVRVEQGRPAGPSSPPWSPPELE